MGKFKHDTYMPENVMRDNLEIVKHTKEQYKKHGERVMSIDN